jgi:hypothetical protein
VNRQHVAVCFGGVEEEQRGYMGLLLLVLGWGWAIVGIFKIVSENWARAGLLFYIFLFILPGFAAAPLGVVLYTRSRRK